MFCCCKYRRFHQQYAKEIYGIFSFIRQLLKHCFRPHQITLSSFHFCFQSNLSIYWSPENKNVSNLRKLMGLLSLISSWFLRYCCLEFSFLFFFSCSIYSCFLLKKTLCIIICFLVFLCYIDSAYKQFIYS